jgi:hypothetical protein
MAKQRLRKQLDRLERDLAAHTKAVERVAQRGRLSEFRPVGTEGAWPAWALALKRQPGCYVIRDAGTRRVLYIGSAKKDLYDTMTRHFQSWRRGKQWWKGMRGPGAHDPGLVYQRSRSQVAIQLTEENERLEVEAALIERFAPRDNLVLHPDGTAEADPGLAGEPDADDMALGDEAFGDEVLGDEEIPF